MNKLTLLLIATLFNALTVNVNAQSYSEAQRGIAAGDDISSYSTLKNHPLYPYLAARFYQQNLDNTSAITALFDTYFSAPPVKTLLNKWVDYHYQLGNYPLIVKHYYDTGNTTANCLYRNAQLQLGNRKAALENIEHIWLSPRSVSEYCSPVFALWSGSRNKNMILKRAVLAYKNKNTDLATRLAERIGVSEATTMSQFSAYLRSPESLLTMPASQLTRTPLHKQLLPKALKALIRKDSSRYASFAMQFASQMKHNDEYQEMLATLTDYLANRVDAQAKSSYRLLTAPSSKATQSLLRYLVNSGDWQAIRTLITPQSNDAMALYWLGRAQEKAGKSPKKAYRKAAQTRSYYGFLAADKLNLPYRFNASPITPDARIQNNLRNNTTLARAKALYVQGDKTQANRELFSVSNRMNLKTVRQLAYSLGREGKHFEAIYMLGKVRDWDGIKTRFPTPYNRQVANAQRITGTEQTWIYAIIRQESSMNPYAVSRTGARGLMQLMPATGRLVAKQLGIELYGDNIFEPSINTQLGAQYLAKMYSRFGSIALASAAYNAGPGRVEQWSVNGFSDMPLWIEKIPFNETRKYVKRILEYQQVYAHHLGKKIPRVTQAMAIKGAM